MEGSVPEFPEIVEGAPDIERDFGGPVGSREVFAIVVLVRNVVVLDAGPFDGESAVQQVCPADGGLRGD